MSHSAEKCKREDPLIFINIHSVAKHQKTRRETLWGYLKKFELKSNSAEKKIERGVGSFVLSLPWPDLALGGFRKVSKKWTDQSEDCSLKKWSLL